ncbi:alternative ribosome rescue aminoacyl-tRNA hydrolase ArfB [Prolixibacter sp. SD074]|jgi:ribosome-associated protein|uniref:alternative ribosome rescue aminoacyl-tRNA hydrolase ArfB n=1 Tax=Prolixibacter sp. SD074 TaxID=2652391 RepID=UPI001283B1E3|nr:alternative ribosome rescue aminoacyl-tRNA hydrolase ArfB [Prolixibacter sp. SD074]GET28398.1 aminoacyl-tRNA hydrolase [Prolixibacter sp. SD074]
MVLHRNFIPELTFTATRSSGAGGQNVNKVNTKVELRFHVESSKLLSQEEKNVLMRKLANRMNKEGELILTEQNERSQLKNKEKVIDRFYRLINWALIPQKRRKATRPTLASRHRRLENKKQHSEKKSRRQNPRLD